MEIKDDFRFLYGNKIQYSRFYNKQSSIDGGTRLDRSYSTSNISTSSTIYHPAAMSDHYLLEVNYDFNQPFNILLIPKPKIPFKIRPEVVNNKNFQNEVENSLKQWENLRSKYNHNILDWWEYLVKPKIREIAIFHSREINKSKTGRLNLLILKQ